MSYDLTGRVVAVNTVPLGDVLAADAPVGSLSLTVEDFADFDENGGSVYFPDTGEVVAYSSGDDETGVLSLTTATANAYLAGDPVRLWDSEAGSDVSETLAEVLVEGTEQGGDTLEAIVDHALVSYLPDGIREVGETVALEWRGDDLFVVNLLGQPVVFDGSKIDPATLPVTDTQPTDGLAPTASPSNVYLRQGIGTVVVQWDEIPNADPVTYDVYAGTTPGFVKDSTTIVGSSPGTGPVFVRTLKDGTLLRPQSNAPDAPHYYFAVWARDADGPAPAPSAEVEGYPGVATSADIAAEAITGDKILGNEILGEHIKGGSIRADHFASDLILGTKITAGNADENGVIAGRRVEISASGIDLLDASGTPLVQLPTEDGSPASFRGHVETESLRVLGGTSIESLTNEIARDGALTLSQGTSTPISPPVTSVLYETLRLDTTTKYAPNYVVGGLPATGFGTIALDPGQITALGWHAGWGHWIVVQQRSGGVRFWHIDATTGKPAKDGSGKDWVEDNGGWDEVTAAWQHDSSQGAFHVFGRIGSDWWLSGRQPDGTYDFNKFPTSHRKNTGQAPTAGWDSTTSRYFVAENWNESTHDEVIIRRYTMSNTANADLVLDSNLILATGTATGYPLTGVQIGTFDYANGNKVAWATQSGYTTAYVASYAADSPIDQTRKWSLGRTVKGFARDGSSFWSVGSDGVMYRYGSWTWTDGLDYLHLGYSWFDSDPAGTVVAPAVDGKHETLLGSRAYLNMPKRAQLQVTLPQVPDKGGVDDPDKYRLYVARSSTSAAPPDSSFRLQYEGGSAAGATNVLIVGGIQTGTAAPPTTNNFPGANPARVKSAAEDSSGPLIDLRGDGSGRWKALEDLLAPVGTIHPYGGASAPSGYLLCNGQAVSRTTYARLYAVLGTTYGAGDGSTTFNLPDLVGRMPMGAGAGVDGVTRALGWKGGQMTLSTANLPSHSHTINHDHANVSFGLEYNATTSTGGTALRVTDIDNVTGGTGTNGTATVNVPSFSGSSGSTGSGSAFLPPANAVNFIIRH